VNFGVMKLVFLAIVVTSWISRVPKLTTRP